MVSWVVPFEPWEKYPSLTREYLAIIGGIVRRARSDTADLHDSAGGDNSWSLGCRAYARTCFALRQATRVYPWLKIIDEDQNLKFTFLIDSIPIRFYHGDASDPPGNYLERTFGELRQQELFADRGAPTDEVLRLAIETDAKGKASTITLVEVGKDNKPTDNTYVIPSERRRKVVPMRSKGIDLPAPTIEPILTEEQKKKRRKRERDAG
jgi:hypothetical protein